MRRMIVIAVVCAWLPVACGGGGDTTDTAEAGDTAAGSSTTASSAVTTTGAPRSSGGYGTVPTTTTVPNSPEAAVDNDRVVETSNTRTSIERTSINGTDYPNALVMNIERYVAQQDWRVELDAGRDFRRFRGDLGIPDDQSSTAAYRVDIVLDNGAPALSVDVRFGETKTIDLDVTNVLRIRIVVSPHTYGELAIGNPRLVR